MYYTFRTRVCVQGVNRGSSAAGPVGASQVTGAVMAPQTAWTTLMSTTAVSTVASCIPESTSRLHRLKQPALLTPGPRACASTAQVTCDESHFQCLSDGECIPDVWVCDDEEDCEDGSDERQQCRKCTFFPTSQMIKISSFSRDDSVICPQLEGRAPVTSSAAATEPASRENTSATTWKTAWTALTRDPAVSRLRGGCLCCVFRSEPPVAF